MKLTRELLEQNDACIDAIRFCERNRLFGFPLSRLDEVKGDYNDFVSWLQCRTFDSNGNTIREVDPDGREWRFEYDQHGNIIHKIDPDGSERFWEYDQQGNMIREGDSDGREWRYEYDQNGNLISLVAPDGRETRWEYDQQGNKTLEVKPDGSETRWDTEFYPNGQLTRIGELVLPQF